jgi:hypothetical protein
MATSAKTGEKPLKPKPTAAAKPATKSTASTAKPAAVKSAAPKAANPVAAKPATAKAEKSTKTPAKATAKPVVSTATIALPPEQRRGYIEVAAYYIAERRGFQGGDAAADWALAEAEIDRLLREGILRP